MTFFIAHPFQARGHAVVSMRAFRVIARLMSVSHVLTAVSPILATLLAARRHGPGQKTLFAQVRPREHSRDCDSLERGERERRLSSEIAAWLYWHLEMCLVVAGRLWRVR